MSSRIPPAEITGVFGAMLKRYSRKELGTVPESLGVMWHNKRVLRHFFGFFGKIEKWDACDEQLKSFAHMAAVANVGCSFCLDYGYFEARNRNIDMEKARAAAGRVHSPPKLSPSDREKVLRDHGG